MFKMRFKDSGRILCWILSFIMVISGTFISGFSVDAESVTSTFYFTDDAITVSGANTGYKISGTALTINTSGVYRLKGSCQEGSVSVKKGTGDVVIIMDNLTLGSSTTAPFAVKKTESGGFQNKVTVHLLGQSSLTDNETDTTSEDYEGAALKVGAGSTLRLCGDGTLDIYGNSKNGIKGGAGSALTIDLDSEEGTLAVKNAVNNGIGFDGSIIINSGIIKVTAENDGIKSVPDTDDTVSSGTITINGGEFDLNVSGDGIQAANDLTINNGIFSIKTLNGYNTSGTKYSSNGNTAAGGDFDSDTMSCKGLKCSPGSDDEASTETTEGETEEESELTCALNINGGEFTLNTADDAIHSDAYCNITGGKFDIYTGDDGVHADTCTVIGKENGYDLDPDIKINACYEGIEGGYVYVYSGRSYIAGLDDGINAAGGTGSEDVPGGESFNPGGPGGTAGPGGPGGTFGPGGSDTPGGMDDPQSQSGDYKIFIEGGNVYINVEGDGIDSNGDIYFNGGYSEIWGMKANGDNEPIDCDGSLYTAGGTVFAAGGKGMDYAHTKLTSSNTQVYKYSTSSYSAKTTIYIKNGNNTVYSAASPKQIAYVFWSSPETTASYSIATSGTAGCVAGNIWSHSFGTGTIEKEAKDTETGIIKYTCSVCNKVIRETLPIENEYVCLEHEYEEDEEDECAHENISVSGWTWSDDYSSAALNYHCNDCGKDKSKSASVTSILKDSDTIEFTAVYTLNEQEYSDTREAAPYVGKFVSDNGVEGIDIYYTQDYSEADETDVSSSVARLSDNGSPVLNGDGQINFKVRFKDGYEINQLSIDENETGEQNYKNIKAQSGDIYRITKITGNLTINITTKEVSSEEASKESTGEASKEASKDSTGEASKESSGETQSDTSKTEDKTKQYGTDGTALGKGASLEAADKAITSMTSDVDPAGTEYGVLKLRATKTTKKSIKFVWQKASGAVKYVVYANKCGYTNKCKKISETTSNKLVLKKINGSALKKGTYYKLMVVAVDKNGNVVSTSKVCHASTTGGKFTNYKKLVLKNVSNNKLTLKTGKKFRIKTKLTKVNSNLKVKVHRKLTYESSDASVATVSSKGLITAKKKGSCYIYVYAQNGIYKRIKITVK